MIKLVELIAYYSGELQPHPPESPLDQRDVILSTLRYLNGYRYTYAMLQDLAKNATDLEAEGK